MENKVNLIEEGFGSDADKQKVLDARWEEFHKKVKEFEDTLAISKNDLIQYAIDNKLYLTDGGYTLATEDEYYCEIGDWYHSSQTC